MTFEELELDEALCHAAADMGFETPTSIPNWLSRMC